MSGSEERSDFRFRGELLKGYWRSRSGSSFLLGLPAVFLTTCLFVAYGWARNPEEVALPAYARQYDAAVESNDKNKQRVVLNALVQLAPRNDEYRYRLAMLKLDEGKTTSAFAMLRALAERSFRKAILLIAQQDIATERATVASVRKSIQMLLPLTQNGAKDPVVHALLGEAYVRIRQPELALPHFRLAVQLDPGYWLTYARLLSATGRAGEAKLTAAHAAKSLQELVASDPADVTRRIQWAKALRASGLLQESVTAISRGLELDRRSQELKGELAQTIFELAISERKGGVVNYRRFSSLLQQAYLLSPDNLEIVTELSELPLLAHKVTAEVLSKVDETLSEKLEETPGDLALQRLTAWCDFQSGRVDSAVNRLRDLAVDDPVARLELASILDANDEKAEAANQIAEATAQLTTLLETDPQPATRLNLARAFTIANRWDEAIALLDTTPADEKTAPEDAAGETATTDMRIQTARIRYRLSRFQQLSSDPDAEADQLRLLQEVLTIDGQNRLAIAGLGTLASRETDVAIKARKLLFDMLAGGENALQIHVQLGTNYLDRQNYKAAVRHLSQAARLAPEDPLVANNLAFALCSTTEASQPDLTRALGCADRALSRLPGNPSILRTRGAVLLKLERHEDALHAFELSLKEEPDSQLTHQYLASTYAALGNEELARAHQVRASK